MTTRKRREPKQRVLVVLDGTKVSEDKSAASMSPLHKAEKALSCPDDEILVLALLFARPYPRQCFRDQQQNIGFLYQEIKQKKGDFKKIFMPFYERCKNTGVKFQFKVSAGFRPKEIVIEEANTFGATWILMDSCFAKDMTFRLSGTDCDVALVDDGEFSESSLNRGTMCNPKSPKLMKGCFKSSVKPPPPPVPCSTSQESEKPQGSEIGKANGFPSLEGPQQVGEVVVDDSRSHFGENVIDRGPLQLTQEALWGLIIGFPIKAWLSQKSFNMEDFKGNTSYVGYLTGSQSGFLLKKLETPCTGILEAEMKAASSLFHNHIMAVKAYHQTDNTTVLVFNIPKGSLLTSYLSDGWRKDRWRLKFQEKLEIAIAVARALRYMHCECPQGPVVHGDLSPSNIYLRNDLQPLIFSFGKSVWLNHAQTLPIASNRCCLKEYTSQATIELVKSDVLSYGVLLLRLFCKKSVPEADKSMIDWARPLLEQRKFHELLEEGVEITDTYGIYRVMTAAAKCTRAKANSRPSMSEVICVLKGQKFCS